MSATVRDNILFCHEFDQEYYDLVLDGMLYFPDTSQLSDHLQLVRYDRT
jgi:hypothetical protein